MRVKLDQSSTTLIPYPSSLKLEPEKTGVQPDTMATVLDTDFLTTSFLALKFAKTSNQMDGCTGWLLEVLLPKT